MQEVEQRMEQLPRHEEHEVLFFRVLRAFVVNKRCVINEKLLIVPAIRQPELLSVTDNTAVLMPTRRR